MSWSPRYVNAAPSRYQGIVEALAADIDSGAVQPGERLPAQRAVAKALGVDLTTVTRAFNEARRLGLIEAQSGRGTFI
ncbi:GntR family transcriptional regulator, partial [Variovorax sp. 2RAF20]